jgi:anti-sigma factor RsiW
MECHDATAQFADYLAGTLPDEVRDAVRAHVETCAACRADLTGTQETWDALGRIPAVAHNSPAMRTRFDATLAEAQSTFHNGTLSRSTSGARGQRARAIALMGLAAAAVLFIGMAIGRLTARPGAPAIDQIAALRAELGEMRQMVSLSLLQQQSAIARLQGVVSTREIDQPGGDVIAALLDVLAFDRNANVRLATIDALRRFMDRDPVRQRTLEVLPKQTSPLVQIALIDFVVESAGAESIPVLRALAASSSVDESVRARAAEGLRRLGVRS